MDSGILQTRRHSTGDPKSTNTELGETRRDTLLSMFDLELTRWGGKRAWASS
jgi:hypothetical protein